MTTSIRVLTWNIHKGMDTGNRRFVLHSMRDALRDIDPDVLLLQEVHGDFFGKRKDISGRADNNQIEFLADEFWQHHVYGRNAVYQRGHHGNAVLSRHPLVEVDNVDVSMMRRASRSLLHVEVRIPAVTAPLHVICVHLGLFGFERERQLARLVEHTRNRLHPDHPVAIAGDFNDWRGKAVRHLSRLEGMDEVFRADSGRYARTFPSFLPLLSMDRVYTRGCEVIGSSQFRGRPWRSLSDHMPLLVQLALP